MQNTLKLLTLAAALSFSISAQAAPIFDTFGALPQATFGGTGIPNDAVAISSQNGVTLGLSATERFSNAPVTNDGAGTFFAAGGSNFGNPLNPADMSLSSTLGATWNFSFFLDLGNDVGSDFTTLSLQYDFDPSAGTDFGVINFNLSPQTSGLSLIEGSQNMLFGFLSSAAAIPIIIPPAGAFDPNAGGTYSFILTASGSNLSPDLVASIDVVVAGVPEPGTLALIGAGLWGLAYTQRRRRKSC